MMRPHDCTYHGFSYYGLSLLSKEDNELQKKYNDIKNNNNELKKYVVNEIQNKDDITMKGLDESKKQVLYCLGLLN